MAQDASETTAQSGARVDAPAPPPSLGRSASDAPAKPAGSQPDRPTTPEKIEVRPPHLFIESWEQTFMKEFHALIPTPRAAKRFVNVYRLLRARATDQRGRERWGNAAGGDHRAVMVLLALLIGFPSEATDLMRELVENKPGGDWWAWSKEHLADPRPGATPAEKERLGALASKLDALQKRFEDQQLTLPGCDVFCRWAPYVGRFSFHAGRLAGLDSE